jgi:tRNA (guanine37-N1)-methyltransferase
MEKPRMRAYSLLGNIALVNFSEKATVNEKKQFANKILKDNSSVKTILEKVGKFKGRLRKISTKHIAGEKTKEVLYSENGCSFRFNIDTTYFSSRLSNERKEIASLVKRNEKVLVMFAGIAVFSIVIAKLSGASVVSNEINKQANKYGKLNVERNKLKEEIELRDGDIKKVAKKLSQENRKFDVIVMPRPQLKDSFLEQAFMLSKKGTRIYYYDFCKTEEMKKIVEKIEKEAKRFKKKVKILRIKKAGEIAPYKSRVRVDFRII